MIKGMKKGSLKELYLKSLFIMTYRDHCYHERNQRSYKLFFMLFSFVLLSTLSCHSFCKQNNSTESIEAWVTSSATNQVAFKPGESKNLVRNSNSTCCLYYIKSAEERKHSLFYNLFHLGTIFENNTLSILGSSLEFICKTSDKTSVSIQVKHKKNPQLNSQVKL